MDGQIFKIKIKIKSGDLYIFYVKNGADLESLFILESQAERTLDL